VGSARSPRFRDWAAAANWISENILGAGSLFQGHEAAKARISDPKKSFVRSLCVLVQQSGRCGAELTCSDLYELAEENGLKVPGLNVATEDAGKRQIGRIMKAVGFRNLDEVSIDGFNVRKVEKCVARHDGNGNFTMTSYIVENVVLNSHSKPQQIPIGSGKVGLSIEVCNFDVVCCGAGDSQSQETVEVF
jgi:hypothetical protein